MIEEFIWQKKKKRIILRKNINFEKKYPVWSKKISLLFAEVSSFDLLNDNKHSTGVLQSHGDYLKFSSKAFMTLHNVLHLYGLVKLLSNLELWPYYWVTLSRKTCKSCTYNVFHFYTMISHDHTEAWSFFKQLYNERAWKSRVRYIWLS